MNRRNRTVLVLLLAVVAGERRQLCRLSHGREHARQGSRSGDGTGRRRGREPRDGDEDREGARQAGRVAGFEPDPGQLLICGCCSGSRPDRADFGQRAADRLQARQPRGRCGVAAVDSRRHARDVGEGERRHRRRRIHRSGHPGRRAGHLE